MEDPYFLERVNAIDTYLVYTLTNQKLFTKDLLKILIDIVCVNENFIAKQKTGYSKNEYLTTGTGQNNINSNDIVRSKKRYDLRRQSNSRLSIDKLIECKKLLTAVISVAISENWQNLNYNP